MRMWSACSTKHQKSNADVCGWLWDREDMHPKIQTLSTNMPSTWPSEALWVNYWNPKSADPRRVWKGNNNDKKSGKYNVFTFCPAAVDLLKKRMPPPSAMVWEMPCHHKSVMTNHQTLEKNQTIGRGGHFWTSMVSCFTSQICWLHPRSY